MTEALSKSELIKEGMGIGLLAGEVATSEYILEYFKDEASPRLQDFLNRILGVAYQKLEKQFDYPAEDIALKVSKLFDK